MKLVRIGHYRCGDYDCVTFALAPDEWDEARIEVEVDKAHEAYMVEFDKARADEAGPPDPGYSPDFKAHPDKTVGEVMAEHQAAREARNAWDKEQAKTRRRFENFLMDRGFVSLWSDEANAQFVEIHWGHRHGQRLQYGEDEIDTMPTPAKLAGRAGDDDEW